MPISYPDPDRATDPRIVALVRRIQGDPDPLVGLTADEAEATLDQAERTARALERQVALDPPSAPEQARRPSLLARLWTRLRRASCGHAAATAQRVPGFDPGPVFERRCGRCGATWSEYG